MKKLFIAASMLLALAGTSFAQTAPAKEATTTSSHKTEVSKDGKLTSTKSAKKVETSTQATQPAAATTTTTTKSSTSTTGPAKKDGSPDKRFKANKLVKKDGTPDKRYKENKQGQ